MSLPLSCQNRRSIPSATKSDQASSRSRNTTRERPFPDGKGRLGRPMVQEGSDHGRKDSTESHPRRASRYGARNPRRAARGDVSHGGGERGRVALLDGMGLGGE